MDFEAIKTAIHGWAVSVIPVETIFLNENGNVPPLPFCTLYAQPVAFFGQDDFVNDDAGQVTYTGQREISVSVQYFGANAMQNAIDLAESLEMQAARDLLAESDLVFVNRAGGANDLSELLDTGYEERAGIDILLRTASIRVQAGIIVESMELDGEYVNADGSTIDRVEIIDTTP